MIYNFITTTGRKTILYLRSMGKIHLFLLSFFCQALKPPFRIRKLIEEMHCIGAKSIFVILLTGSFTGMVLGLQGYYTLRKFGSEGLLGSAVALSLIRELGPVLAAIMVTARAGSAMAAEIGTMKITEQIDALDVMTLNPIKYLVAPKMIAGTLVMPLLVSIFDVIGILGGYLVGVKLMGVNHGSFIHSMESNVVFADVSSGIIKAFVFGFLVTWISCYKGYTTGRGATGIGKSTTEAVVYSAIGIFAWDYFLTSVLL